MMTQSISHRFFAYVFLLVASAAACAEVGTQSTQFTIDGQKFDARIWYPAQPGVAKAAKAAPPAPDAPLEPLAGARLPLVVLVHGTGGHRDGLAWLALALAERGALVVAANHPGSTHGASVDDVLTVWRQPQQVRAMLTQLQASPWGARIAADKVAVAGFSLGGYTALALAGARVEMEKLVQFCAKHGDTGACRYFVNTFPKLDAAHFQRANVDHFEARIKAAVAIAPGLAESMVPASITGLKTPVLLIAPENDIQLPTPLQARPLGRLLPPHSTYHEIKNAGHFSFLPLMSAKTCAMLAEEGEGFVCAETPAKTREQIHAEAIDAAIAFLRRSKILD